MSEMVERVARILASERDEADPASNGRLTGDDGTNYPAGIPRWKAHEEWARDILAAMREATPAMYGAGNRKLHVETEEIGEIWKAMIDEALNDRNTKSG